MGAQCVLGHELFGDLTRECGLDAAADIDLSQFFSFEVWIFRKLPSLSCKVGPRRFDANTSDAECEVLAKDRNMDLEKVVELRNL